MRLDVAVDSPFSPHTGELLCPQCGEESLHHEYVVCYDRPDDGSETTITFVDYGTLRQKIVKSNSEEGKSNPSFRRDGIVIGFVCEHCSWSDKPNPPVFELTFAQHKGHTLLEWRIKSDAVSHD